MTTRWQDAAARRAQTRRGDPVIMVYLVALLLALGVVAWVGR